ncbi:MAG: hypothetical protein J5803_04700 [Desulfovibrio sp.]|nr:hypothetical protein [Desulfovibrio sp.]
MKHFFMMSVFFGLVFFFSSSAMATKTYVYCSSGKIELDNRDPQQMKAARGSGTYVMGPGFEMIKDAQEFAKQLGGVGAKCPRK